MARQMKKFAEGGSDKYKAKMDRKTADIESDYQKALKKGKNADVAKAKYEQRMADAKDDYAKWTKADRTQTRAGEKAAESALSEARRTKGASIRDRDAATRAVERIGGDEPLKTKIDTSLAGRAQTKRAAPKAAPKPAAKPAPKKTVADTAKKAVETPKAATPTKVAPKGNMDAARRMAPATLRAPTPATSEKVNPKQSALIQKMTTPSNEYRRAQKLSGLEKAANAPGASGYAKDRYKYARETGMVGNYAKGGKIDGCAVRGKTRAR